MEKEYIKLGKWYVGLPPAKQLAALSLAVIIMLAVTVKVLADKLDLINLKLNNAYEDRSNMQDRLYNMANRFQEEKYNDRIKCETEKQELLKMISDGKFKK